MSMGAERGLTEIMMSQAESGVMTTGEAVRYLKENARARTVREVLARELGMDPSDDKALWRALVDLLVKSNPGEKRESTERKVRGWLKDGIVEISKAGAIQLCYALGRGLEDAEALLPRLCGERLHWRSPEDIVWIYGLKQGLPYQDAVKLRARLAEKGLMKPQKAENAETMTAVVRQEVTALSGEAELTAFLLEAAPRLGRMHNTAYGIFIQMLELLQDPGDGDLMPKERSMAVREIMATYLYNGCIPRARRGDKKQAVDKTVMSAIQRDIRQNWPDETTLSKMQHREADVTRKVLILLFLATDGGESAYGDLSDDEAEMVFQSMELRLNTMLADCGFPPLDPRTPFDWMVLYCMCADESIFIDDNVRAFLAGIFPENAEAE